MRSCHPFPDSFVSSLGFVLFSDVWLVIFCYSAFRVLSFRTVEITPDGVQDAMRFLGWRIRSRSVSFLKPHFVDFKDYRGGFPVARERTRFLFVGPGCQITIDVEKDRAAQIKQLAALVTP